MSEVALTAAGWSALRATLDGLPGASKGGVTNCVNQGVLERTEAGVVVTELGRDVAQVVWGRSES